MFRMKKFLLSVRAIYMKSLNFSLLAAFGPLSI